MNFTCGTEDDDKRLVFLLVAWAGPLREPLKGRGQVAEHAALKFSSEAAALSAFEAVYDKSKP